MSIKRDYKTKTDDGMELEPLDFPKSPDKENSKTNGIQFGKCILTLLKLNQNKYKFCPKLLLAMR